MPDEKWICQGCTAQNYPDSIYCCKCGNTLAQVVVIKPPAPAKLHISTKILLGIIVIVVSIGIYFVGKFNLMRMPEDYPGTSVEKQRIIELAGSMPELNPRDGVVFCVRDFMRNEACSPNCGTYIGWTKPVLVTRGETVYWVVHAVVQYVDRYGDSIQNRRTFFIQHHTVQFAE